MERRYFKLADHGAPVAAMQSHNSQWLEQPKKRGGLKAAPQSTFQQVP